jgi:hypothetical protein
MTQYLMQPMVEWLQGGGTGYEAVAWFVSINKLEDPNNLPLLRTMLFEYVPPPTSPSVLTTPGSYWANTVPHAGDSRLARSHVQASPLAGRQEVFDDRPSCAASVAGRRWLGAARLPSWRWLARDQAEAQPKAADFARVPGNKFCLSVVPVSLL